MSTKTIRISERLYNKLSKMGTLADSFDSVIEKLVEQRQSAGN
jgi:predicted CopG family antitoxin